MTDLQARRLHLLNQLDSAKTRPARNQLGQFATPPRVADEMMRHALSYVQKQAIRYLEPGFGTGAFFNRLIEAMEDKADGSRILEARGYEIDPHYAAPVARLYSETVLDLRVTDFTEAKPEPFDVILCNPPYVRHHHLPSEKKVALADAVQKRYGIRPTGLTGLYNYFMMLGEAWLSPDGIAAWLVPSEFLDVNYGVAVKSFLLRQVCLERIHLYESEDVQFEDALVSSAVVWYRKGPAAPDKPVELSFGGSMEKPASRRFVKRRTLSPNAKWTRLIKQNFLQPTPAVSQSHKPYLLKDFFVVKRGIATGDNQFFILSEGQVAERAIPKAMLSPVLPSPRYLKSDVVESDSQGVPANIDRLFLLNCRQTPDMLAANHVTTWHYLQSGVGTVSEKYLCSSRRLWYLQEEREAAPLLCTYMGRGTKADKRPFRFILNQSKAVATNSYLMLYPKPFWKQRLTRDPGLLRQVWELLNNITTDDLIMEGRTYGGGLEKIEPSELGNVPVRQLAELLDYSATPLFA